MSNRRHRFEPPQYNKMYLDRKNGRIGGVFAGMADYFGVDVTILRVAAIIAMFVVTPGPIIIGYLLLKWLLPDRPVDLYDDEREDEFWKNVRIEPKNTIRDVRHKFRDIERRLRAAEANVTSKEYKLRKEFRDLETR